MDAKACDFHDVAYGRSEDELSDVTGDVIARGVRWLGAAAGPHVRNRTDPSGYADRVAGAPLFGNAHGPRLLELLDAACG